MEKKPYSDRRWWDNPMPIFSLCGKCKHWRGRDKCDKYDSIIPEKVMDKSFPGTEEYDENYCPYRTEK